VRRDSLAVLLLAERARSEGARSTRAFEDRPGRPWRDRGRECERGAGKGVRGHFCMSRRG